MQGKWCMSSKELDRIKVINELAKGLMKQGQAALQLGLSVRQIKRLLKKFRAFGDLGLLKQPKMSKTPRSYDETFKQKALAIIQEHYSDFGPTLATEKLAERHGIVIATETARQWMIGQGIHRPKQRQYRKVHNIRARRPCYGEMIQIDGSDHDWFEGRAERCTLLVFIDDATSQIQHLRFVESESTSDYMRATWDYLVRYGKPISFYSDKHSVFSVNAKEAESGTGLTQFSRALEALEIELILAHSPQAKGRVERCNRTLQDRLVKEMRLLNICSIEQANAVADTLRLKHNVQFAQPPLSPLDAHRALEPHELAQLPLHFSIQTTRKVSKRLTIQYKQKTYQLHFPSSGYRLQQKGITICEMLDGSLQLLYEGEPLSYEVFDKGQRILAVLDSKQIDIHFQEKKHKPAPNHPWRQFHLPGSNPTEQRSHL